MARRSRSSENNAPSKWGNVDRTRTDPLVNDRLEDNEEGLDEEDDGDSGPVVDEPSINAHGHLANARDGLNIRSGSRVEFPIIRSLPLGTPLNLLRREGRRGLIDERGDGAADGFVHLAFLNEQASGGLSPTTLLSDDQARTFWGQRNPRLAKLYDRLGHPLVDPSLLHASAPGTSEFEAQNQNYRIEMYGPGAASGPEEARPTTAHNLAGDEAQRWIS